MSRFMTLISLVSLAALCPEHAYSSVSGSLLHEMRELRTSFPGTGTDSEDRDASIQGTAHLTFTRLDSYDLSACEGRVGYAVDTSVDPDGYELVFGSANTYKNTRGYMGSAFLDKCDRRSSLR
ncbi:hypothetical protein BDN72DRAFT_898663 [Pluteus cervinus]|uniref:Uncharacterized protein n=1 Tax=Pluteus cervinus TaxID=181527 RepID=A0ACD3APG5_9AGAR|nr:hypothetical protein BDN72DRAFT_898663 [Pluteus cervinus]